MLRTLAPALFLALAACSTTPSADVVDVPVLDMGPDEGVDRCGVAPPVVAGATITPGEVNGPIGAQTGGAITDGKYVLTQINRYADAQRPTSLDRSTLVIQGVYWDFAFGTGGTMASQPRYKRISFDQPDGSANFDGRCDTTTGLMLKYTLTGTRLTIVFGDDPGVEFVYNKQMM